MVLTFLCGRGVWEASAQVEMSASAMEPSGTFNLDAIVFAGATRGQERLDVFIQVGYEALSFTKRDDRYYASYELTLSLYDSAGSLVNEKTWTEEVKGLTFDQSVSSTGYALTQRTLSVGPGAHRLTVALTDNESKMTRHLETPVLVTDMWEKPFSLSDIMLLSRVSQQGEKRSMVPNVGGNVGEIPDFFYLYCEAYNRERRDSVRILMSIADQKREKVVEFDTLLALRPGRNEEILKVSHGSLQLGDYRIFLRAYPTSFQPPLDTGYIASTNRAIIVRWYGMPKSMKDLDLAIDQVRWIAKDDEITYLKAATTPEEKQKRFLEFWKKRDPNPNTPRNEKMEEYYQRVDYANRHFTHFREGWRTDMGMVYLMFGPPNNVDRHPFDSDAKPYEIWSYYDLSFQAVFLDETGFGDYRLLNSLSEVYDKARMRR